MISLKDFYDRYTAMGAGKEALKKERQETLMAFQRYLLEHNYIKRKGLQVLSGNLNQHPENLLQFHYALLSFLLSHVTEVNAGKEPFLSIRLYFCLQERGVPSVSDGAHIRRPADYAYDLSKTFVYWVSQLKKILDVKQPQLRDALRLHTKFFRSSKSTRLGSASDKLQTAIRERINAATDAEREDPIVLDGYSARAIIIALNKTMKDMTKLSPSKKVIYFKIGETFIKWLPKPAKDHGRLFIEMEYWNTSKTRRIDFSTSTRPDKDLLHKFPYEEGLVLRLQSLEAKLKTVPQNLMALMLKKFSHRLEAFVAAEFTSIDEAELHFLNAFTFLNQIAEIARYMKDGLNTRDIEDEPLSIASAISKNLKIGGKLNWKELYSDAPAVLKGKLVGKTKKWESYKQYGKEKWKIVPSDASVIRGIDPTSGKDLAINIEVVRNKITYLAGRYPEHLSGIKSARSVLELFSTSYGRGAESDGDDSVYSLREMHFNPNDNLEKIVNGFNAWCGKDHSFFSTVASQLTILGINAEDYSHLNLPVAIFSHAVDNWFNFAGFITDFDDSCARMSTTGEWRDDDVIVATAIYLKVNIRIYLADGAQRTFIKVGSAHEVALSYEDGSYSPFTPESLESAATLRLN